MNKTVNTAQSILLDGIETIIKEEALDRKELMSRISHQAFQAEMFMLVLKVFQESLDIQETDEHNNIIDIGS